MAYDVDIVFLPPQPAVVVRGHVDPSGIAGFLGRAFGETLAALQAEHLQPAGPPFARYRAAADGGWDVEAGFPATGPVHGQGGVEAAELPGGWVAHTLHHGDYGAVGAAYEAVETWLREHHAGTNGQPWEAYLDGPDVPEPRTELFVPCG